MGPRIVAEIRNPTNLEAARLVGNDRTVLLDIRDIVAKLLVQTSRQSGAAAVYVELFDYDGDEIYFLAEHDLAGATYAEAQLHFESASVIGLVEDGDADPQPGARHACRRPHPHRGRRGRRGPGRPAAGDRRSPDLGAPGHRRRGRPHASRPRRCSSGGTSARRSCSASSTSTRAPGSTLTVLTAYGDDVAALPDARPTSR